MGSHTNVSSAEFFYPILDLSPQHPILVFPSLDYKSIQQLISFWKIIPYSRPKISDLYALSQSKLLKNHTLRSGTYLSSPYMAGPPGAKRSQRSNCTPKTRGTAVVPHTLWATRVCATIQRFFASLTLEAQWKMKNLPSVPGFILLQFNSGRESVFPLNS